MNSDWQKGKFKKSKFRVTKTNFCLAELVSASQLRLNGESEMNSDWQRVDSDWQRVSSD